MEQKEEPVLTALVAMELAPVDIMAAVQYWLTHQVLKPGIQIDVIDVEQNHSTNVFKIKFNQVIQVVPKL